MSSTRRQNGLLRLRGAAILVVWALVQATVWSGSLESVPNPPHLFVGTSDTTTWTAADENEPTGTTLLTLNSEPGPPNVPARRPGRGRAEPSSKRFGFHGFSTPAKERDPPPLPWELRTITRTGS